MRTGDYRVGLTAALKEVRVLRECYQSAFKEIAPADNAVRRLCACLTAEDVVLALDQLGSRVDHSPRDLTSVTEAQNRREQELGRYFGFSRRDVRHHISRCAGLPRWATPVVRTSAELIVYLKDRHESLRAEFTSPLRRGVLVRKKIKSDADVLVFSVGILLADALSRPDLPTSYGLFNMLSGRAQ